MYDLGRQRRLAVFGLPVFLLLSGGAAAWVIEGTPQDLGLIYRGMGRKGLESMETVGPKMAGVVEGLIEAQSS